MNRNFPISRILVAGLAMSLSSVLNAQPAGAPDDIIPGPVSKHTAVFTAQPWRVPTELMPDGPLLGNGDVGVVLGGPASEQFFFIGKNDFWRTKPAMVKRVGAIRMMIPALQGASYRQEQDLARAEVRGTFTKGDLTVQTRSWVAATENLLVTELTCNRPVPVSVDQQAGGLLQVKESGENVRIGLEGSGNGRWYFDGIIDDVRLYDRGLSAEEIQSLVAGRGPQNGLVRSWPANAPAETKVIGGGDPVDGKVGRSLHFDGKQTCVDLGPLQVTSTVTLSAWVNPASLSPDANYIISKGGWNQAYSLGLSGGHIRMSVGDSYVQTSETIVLNQWQQITGVFDGRDLAVYVNGILKAHTDNGSLVVHERDEKTATCGMTRRAELGTVAGGRMVSVATRVMGAKVRPGKDQSLEFDLVPGQPVWIASAVLSDLDAKDHLAAASKKTALLNQRDLALLQDQHRKWWAGFWSKSYIEIPDPLIEKYWYGALYALASCSREGKIAPGMWGNWITTSAPKWQGDYTLNYNFQAQYYITYSANHAELSLPFYKAINDFIPTGLQIAKTKGWKGVEYPTHIGPWALLTELWDENGIGDFGQRSDAAFAALNFIWYYQYTQDKNWLKTAGYPFLIEVVNFWEDYLKFENGRYVIYNDSLHEGSGPDFNGLLSLGLVRTLFKSMIAFSQDLNMDAGRRAKWQDIVNHLADYPLQERNGKTVFRYTEKGMDWCDSNGLGIMHIYPAGAIGLDSDPKLLETSRNMITEMKRWEDYNCFSSYYAAAVRVGYDPAEILKRLKKECERCGMPNAILFYGPGGLENCGAFVMLDEMLLQSHEGVIRLFPCWPKDQDARFGTLRAYGAFLVSAELKNGTIDGVKIISEMGRNCTVVNPWPDKPVKLTRNGRNAEILKGARLTFKTAPNESINLMPM